MIKTKIINGLHVNYCRNCNNQLNHLNYGGRDTCKKNDFDCKKCTKPCTGLKNEYETGYYDKKIIGYCKRCNTKCIY